MPRMKRGLIAGTLLGPLAIVPVLTIGAPIVAAVMGVPGTFTSLVTQALLASVYGLVVAYFVAAVVCTPITIGLVKIDQFKLPVVVFLSLLVSVAFHYLQLQFSTRVSPLALYLVLGLSVGLGYWYAFNRGAQ